MYNGFDWYGRTLEVREVRKMISLQRSAIELGFFRIVMQDSQALVHIVGVFAEFVVHEVEDSVVDCVADSAEDLVAQPPAETSLVKTYTPIIQVLIKQVPLQVPTVADMVMVVVMVVPTMLSQANKSWFAM
jgi:hypothetical protein